MNHAMNDAPATPDENAIDDDGPPATGPVVVVHAAELFGEQREIVIEHAGERYRLRITRRGKLILQK